MCHKETYELTEEPTWTPGCLAVGRFAGPGQHGNARKHNFCPFDVEPNLAESALNVERGEADSVRIIHDAAEEVPRSKRRAFASVVHQKVITLPT